jgi:hypothetical protein
MFLMNYLFDFDIKTGRFSGDRDSPAHPGALYRSKNWLKLRNKVTPEPPPFTEGTPSFDPDVLERAAWTDLMDMDTGTLCVLSTPKVGTGNPPVPDESNFGIRIGLDPNSKDTEATKRLTANPPVIELAVCFGKPSTAGQNRSSPFYLSPAPDTPDEDQIVLTTFIHTFRSPTGHDTLGHPTWFYPIGLARFRPTGSEHKTHRYEFAVGITVKDAEGVIHHYSHDPEMDIGL